MQPNKPQKCSICNQNRISFIKVVFNKSFQVICLEGFVFIRICYEQTVIDSNGTYRSIGGGPIGILFEPGVLPDSIASCI